MQEKYKMLAEWADKMSKRDMGEDEMIAKVMVSLLVVMATKEQLVAALEMAEKGQ